MSAVTEAHEPSARYLVAEQPALVRQFGLLTTAPGGVAQLRKLILTLAVRGKLVPQNPQDQSAAKLLEVLRDDKAQLIAAGKAKRDRQLPTIATEEQPYELPPHWEWVRLGELAELITSGSRDWAEHYSPSGAIFVRMGNLSRGSFRLRMQSVQHVRPPISGEGSRTSLQEGDLLLSITGDVGLLGLVPPGFGEAYINQHTCLIRWLPRLRGEFMPVQLLSPFAQAQFNAPQRGIKNSFRLTDVSGLLVALPPLAEQARIVARVDELMRLCDALEAKGRLEAEQHARLLGTLLGTLTDSSTPKELAANWRRVADHFDLLLDRPEAVDALEQTILQLAVRGLLLPQDQSDEPAETLLMRIREHKAQLVSAGAIRAARPVVEIAADELPFKLPQTWAWARFGDITINRDGERVPVSSSDRELRTKVYDYYGASGVIDKIDGYLFDKTLLLIGEDGANLLNRSAPIAFLAHGKYWVNNHAHVIDAMDAGLMRYLELFINAISLEPYVTGTAQPKMNQAKLSSIVVALPPLAEQSRIVSRVNELRRLCDDLRHRLERSSATHVSLADALIDQALST